MEQFGNKKLYILVGRTGEYCLLNRPITVRVLTERYIKIAVSMVVSFVGNKPFDSSDVYVHAMVWKKLKTFSYLVLIGFFIFRVYYMYMQIHFFIFTL